MEIIDSICPRKNGRQDPTREIRLTAAQQMFQRVLSSSIVLHEEWDALHDDSREEVIGCQSLSELLGHLVRHGLITDYQAGRIEANTLYGLILGQYRVLDRIGAGGMGIVFLAEHTVMRRQVAIKVLPLSQQEDPGVLRRFLTEMRAVSQLYHPNIVAALDAGRCNDPEGNSPTLHYFVMEYVPGQDLEEFVKLHGSLAPTVACDLMHQVASALSEAHKHNLVHRDIKPSNVRITPEGQAKLLDFGLARHLSRRQTQPGIVLGTLDFMAPEQARDASSVDIRADIYGLGGTLFWCLVGRFPFEAKVNLLEEVTYRLTQEAPLVRSLRPEIPEALEAVVAKMMALRPEDRYQTPQAVMNALSPFLAQSYRECIIPPEKVASELNSAEALLGTPAARKHNILIADDEPFLRQFTSFALSSNETACEVVNDGLECLDALRKKEYDLVVIDVQMPGMKGPDICRILRQDPPSPHLKILIMSGCATGDELAEIMVAGADDYLLKPLSRTQLQARVSSLLRLKDAQDRSDLLTRHLLAVNQHLEENLNSQDSDLVHARNALVLALGELVGYRDTQSGSHLVRRQKFTRCLAEEAARTPVFCGVIDRNFINMLECCIPLQDIGKVALPDHILMKPGKLSPDERIIMQTHTTIGAETLQKVSEAHGFAQAFLQMAIEITRHHHERYDGQGYPDRLVGEQIPLSARIAAVADVYDALRTRRVYKPALSHNTVVRMMLDEFQGHFDPSLLQAFERCAGTFEQIYREHGC